MTDEKKAIENAALKIHAEELLDISPHGKVSYLFTDTLGRWHYWAEEEGKPVKRFRVDELGDLEYLRLDEWIYIVTI